MQNAELYRQEFDQFLERHFAARLKDLPVRALKLLESVRYSVFTGGKRFRPLVSGLTADALGLSREKVWPFAAAVEMIHTYSLIHDDLPCMDDDDERRGKPTNHRVYGESMALLAGDALLTEAFFVLGQYYADKSDVGLTLTRELSLAAGLSGMVAGQVMDITVSTDFTRDELIKMHELKTGALIRVAVTGVGEIAQATTENKLALQTFGGHLGLAFQLADDLLDFDPQNSELSGFPRHLGLEVTQKMLKETTTQAIQLLEPFGSRAQGLRSLVEYNLNRQV